MRNTPPITAGGRHDIAGDVGFGDRQEFRVKAARVATAAAPQAVIDRNLRRMKPRIMASRPEISITTQAGIRSSHVMGHGSLRRCRAVRR